MGAVTGGVWRVLSGEAPPELAKSVAGYVGAFNYIEVEPWHTPWPLWGLVVCGAIVAVRYRRDPTIAALVLLPQALAIAGYALFLDTLDHYYYIPVMPVTVLTVCFALAVPARSRAGRADRHRALPCGRGHRPLAAGVCRDHAPPAGVSRAGRGVAEIAAAHPSVRAIRTEFTLPPSTDPEFLYRILGGRVDPNAPRAALIQTDGSVRYVEGDP